MSSQDWDYVADAYCRDYAIPYDRRSRGSHALERKYRKWLKAGANGVEQDEASVALAVKAQIGAKALKKKRATIPEDFRTKNVMVVTTRSNMKITKAGGRRETVIAEEVENGEEDGSTTSSKGGNTSSAAAKLRYGGRTVTQEVYSASSKRDVRPCVRKDLSPMANLWERVRKAYGSDGPKLWIKSQYREPVSLSKTTMSQLTEEVSEARTTQSEIDLHLNSRKRQRSNSASYDLSPRTLEKYLTEDSERSSDEED